MKLSVRGRLFAGSVVIIVAAVLASGAYLGSELRGREEARIETELRRHALTVRESLHDVREESIETLDPIADRLGAATSARITIVAADGRVLGDSELTATKIRGVENHGQRPEVLGAIANEIGKSRRYSATLKTDMLYVAVAWEGGDGVGVVRAAMPLYEVDEVMAQLRAVLLVAGVVGLALALVMSLIASQLLSGQLRRLVRSARAVARGNGERRVDMSTDDELGGIAGSLNRMAEELEQTVSQLAGERGRLRAVLEGMGEAVVALNARSRIELVNRTAMELLGITEAAIGDTLLETVPIDELKVLTAAAHGGETAEAEFELPGRARRVHATATPQPGGAGCVIVLHDVTALRRLERVRRDFVANVSHELRTPVSVIRANAETLLDGGPSDAEAAQSMREALVRHSTRLSDILADLLDLSRLEAGKVELVETPVAVAEVARRAAETVVSAAARKGIRIQIDAAAKSTVRADDHALEQILVNLMDNAVKYSPDDSQVLVRTSGAGEQVRIEVCDGGPGVDSGNAERIFERFYRVDAGRSRQLGGTGLGLSIVKHLAEAMGGDVGVEPNEPQGSRFWVQLPAVDG